MKPLFSVSPMLVIGIFCLCLSSISPNDAWGSKVWYKINAFCERCGQYQKWLARHGELSGSKKELHTYASEAGVLKAIGKLGNKKCKHCEKKLLYGFAKLDPGEITPKHTKHKTTKDRAASAAAKPED